MIDHEHQLSKSRGQKNIRKFTLAIIVTFIFAVIEAVAGYISGSLALMSDAGHMITDVMSLAIALFACWIAMRPASSRHTYGYLRIETLAALINGLSMLIIVIIIVIEAIARIYHPSEVHGLTVFIVASLGLIANIFIIFVLSRDSHDLNTQAAILHVLGDLLGSIAAILAGAIIYFTGWNMADPILSIVISLLILYSNVKLLKEAFSILMEAVPQNLKLSDVGKNMAQVANVASVHDLHIWNITSEYVALSAHVVIDSMQHWPQILHQISNVLKTQYNITHITLQPEIAAQYIPLEDRVSI
jgi:cobalt-zinc-cadmium efflux system protein